MSEFPAAVREVPTYTVYELASRASKYAVIIPVINEGERLLGQLRRMRDVPGMGDVIIGDGGSKDSSGDPAVLKELGVRALLVKTGPGKLSAQLRMLMDYALNEGYEGLVMIDGNPAMARMGWRRCLRSLRRWMRGLIMCRGRGTCRVGLRRTRRGNGRLA